MTVIMFPPATAARATGTLGGWSADELRVILESLALRLEGSEASGWDVGSTETGDPQFYLLGPLPDEDCILCISRLGRVYVLEDGTGQVVSEYRNLRMLGERARKWSRRERPRITAPLFMLWCGLRDFFEQRVEPMLVEGEELLAHLVPQLGAFA